MNSEIKDTLAKKLGTSVHLSPLIQKAKRLGLVEPSDLEEMAIARGLTYYGKTSTRTLDLECLSIEELVIALMSPTLPYSLQRLRMAGALLGAKNLSADRLVKLARMERCESTLRYIAEMAAQVEPMHVFWLSLLERLPASPPAPPDVLPHLTRLVTYSGLDRTGRVRQMQWIRPTS